MKTVNDLHQGETGTIGFIQAPGDIRRRLMDMGIIEGAEIEMIRTAPLGDPVEIRVHNTLIALRRTEAARLILRQEQVEHHGRKQYRHRFGG